MESGFQERVQTIELLLQFFYVQTVQERLLVGHAQKHLAEQRSGLFPHPYLALFHRYPLPSV